MPIFSIPTENKNLDILEIGAPNLEQIMDKTIMSYGPSNPHPGYGKDPNIINEYGHTKYPKWIDLPNGTRQIANSPAHEAELTGKPIEVPKEEKKKKKTEPLQEDKNPWG